MQEYHIIGQTTQQVVSIWNQHQIKETLIYYKLNYSSNIKINYEFKNIQVLDI
jgi:hypothetical protein